MAHSHHIVFRKELGSAYPTFGLPLWEPGPGGNEAVEVGDVGFVREGYFHRLFNVLHPRDHPSNQGPIPAPEDHEQLELGLGHIHTTQIRGDRGQNYFRSRHVFMSQGLGPSASR